MSKVMRLRQSQHKVLTVDFAANRLLRDRELSVVCIADTHKSINFSLAECHFAICAGDVCSTGTENNFRDFIKWFASQPAAHKIYVPGNHDMFCEKKIDYAKNIAYLHGVKFLHNSGTTIDGLSFWGTATQPFFCNWSFNVIDARDRAKDYALIPDGTDVLITHCPPKGILDIVPPSAWNDYNTEDHVGCHALLKAVERAKPRFHVFGHIHHSYGECSKDGTLFINASICDEKYDQVNAPITFNLRKPAD